MRLITGGIFQGKVKYAQETYGIPSSGTVDAAQASEEELEQAALVYHLQEYIRSHHQGETCELPAFREDAVIICDEAHAGEAAPSPDRAAFP